MEYCELFFLPKTPGCVQAAVGYCASGCMVGKQLHGPVQVAVL